MFLGEIVFARRQNTFFLCLICLCNRTFLMRYPISWCWRIHSFNYNCCCLQQQQQQGLQQLLVSSLLGTYRFNKQFTCFL